MGPYLADGKNNDANILNKTLLIDDALQNRYWEDDILFFTKLEVLEIH